jgi:hypothetical protein
MRRTLGRAGLGFLAAFTLIASGCASMRPYDPGPGRRAAAGLVQSSFASGAPINVTIANLSDITLFYPDGFCKTELQKKEQGGWLTISKPTKTCPDELGFLDPGQTVVHPYQLPSDLGDGTYRLAMPMPLPDDALGPEPHLLTPAFRVENPLSAGTAATAPTAVTVNSPSTTQAPRDH